MAPNNRSTYIYDLVICENNEPEIVKKLRVNLDHYQAGKFKNKKLN